MSLQNSSVRRSIALAFYVFLAFAMVALPAVTQAQSSDAKTGNEKSGDGDKPLFYLEYNAGVVFVPDQNVTTDDNLFPVLGGSSETEPGYVFGGAFGVSVLDSFRAELRADYRQAEAKQIAIQGESADANGKTSLFSLMLNGYFDLETGLGFVPYIGAGVGYGRLVIDAQNEGGANRLAVDDRKNTVVWNAMAGVSVPLSKIADFTFGYRYVGAMDVRARATAGTVRRNLKYEYDSHEGTVGIRFRF